MSKNTVTLKSITTKGFMGLGGNSPLLIDFGEFRKKHKSNIVNRTGDGNEGKSRWLYLLEYCMGVDIDVKNDRLPDFDTNKMEGILDFEFNGFELRSRFSKSKFVVEEKVETSTGEQWTERKSPKSLLHEIFKTATADTSLKFKSGTLQVEWFTSVFPLSGEYKEIIENNTTKLLNLIEDRKQLKRDIISKKGELMNNPTYLTYIDQKEKFVSNIENIRKNKFDEDAYEKLLEQKANKTVEENKLKNFKTIVSDEEKKLAELQEQLKEIQAKIVTSESNVEKGKKSIEKQKNVVKGLSDIDEKVDAQKELKETFSSDMAAVRAYDEMLQKEQVYNDLETKHQLVDSDAVNLKQLLIQARKESSPDIKNVEVVADVFDNEDDNTNDGSRVSGWKEKGIYFKGTPLSNLSGSDYAECIISIMEASGARFVFADDFATLGSGAVEYIKKLAKKIEPEGGMVFVTEMRRNQKIEITTL